MRKKKEITDLPNPEQIEAVLSKYQYRSRYRHAVRNVMIVLITVSAVIVLLTMLLLPVMRIYGKSMTPALNSGNIVVSVRYTECKQGDVIAFYYNNKVLVKRIIAVAGDIVEMQEDGTVLINHEVLDEPYLSEKVLGDCDIEFPYQVPEEQFFVMGDNRTTSVDSRREEVGCIESDQIIGKIIFRVFPLETIGIIQ